jgi:hypothetical protein
METNKKVAVGLAALGVMGAAGLYYAKSAAAKAVSGEPYVLQMLKTTGYRVLPIAASNEMSMVEPDPSSKGLKLYDWVAAEQKKGRAVLIPAQYYQGTMSASPSQIVSVDQRFGAGMTALGIFKLAPSLVTPAVKTGDAFAVGATSAPNVPSSKQLAIGAAVAAVAIGSTVYVFKD